MFSRFESRPQRLAYAVSISLTLMRAALAGVLLLFATEDGAGLNVAVALCVGFVSDVYDGVIARRFGVATAGLRRLDSAADTVFYLSGAICVWRFHPDVVLSNRWLLVAVIGTLVVNHAVEWAKFGREASYHAWLAKAWGVALFVSLVTLFAGGTVRLVPAALYLGILSHLENFAITIALPEWRHDVRSVWHAWSVRRSILDAVTGDPNAIRGARP